MGLAGGQSAAWECDVSTSFTPAQIKRIRISGGGGGGRKRYFIEYKVLLVSRKYNVDLGSGFAGESQTIVKVKNTPI